MAIKKRSTKKISTQKTKTNKVLNVILLGDPGAGKATQAAYFAKKYNMLDFDMGRELTLLRQKNKTIDKIQRQTSDRGALTPTAIVRKINRQKILQTPTSKGILFDGHPKMLGEAKIISKLLKDTKRENPIVLYLKIPTTEIINRVQNRKGYFETKFNKRADDSKIALRNRAKYYRKNISEVVKFFQNNYPFKYIDGMGTRSQVRTRIQKTLNNLNG